jgi:hypothetical protein
MKALIATCAASACAVIMFISLAVNSYNSTFTERGYSQQMVPGSQSPVWISPQTNCPCQTR